jgi:hypothetical protein
MSSPYTSINWPWVLMGDMCLPKTNSITLWTWQDHVPLWVAKLLLDPYLQNRYKKVQITNSYSNSNTVSKWTKIKYGVPQGAILGPVLFLVYINDLPKAIEHKTLPILFADDTSILLTSPILKCRVILI